MSSRFFGVRRSAANSNPFIALSKAVAGNASGVGRQAAVIVAASGLVVAGSVAANAADVPAQRESTPVAVEAVAQDATPITVAATATVSFERPVVASEAAPVVVETPAPVAAAPAAAPTTRVAAKAAAPATAPAPAAVAPAGSINATMVASAYAQIGIFQDCTAMVERALRAAGIPVGDLAPMQFMNYGRVVSDPQPGDMIVQPGHVGIYLGNGQVLSGGINGNQTAIHPLSWLTATGPVTFVRAGA